MLVIGAVFGFVAVAGAVTAVSTRSPRLAILGLLVALLAAPFVADPLPDLRGTVARITGAALVAYPLVMVTRGRGPSISGSRSGWPADVLLAITAAIAATGAAAGWEGAVKLLPGLGTGEPAGLPAGVATTPIFLPAIAAAAAVLALAAGPTAVARDPLRLTVGLCLAVLGLTLLRAGLSGPLTAFADLCTAVLLATIAGGGALLIRAARRPGDVPHGTGSTATPDPRR